MEEAQLGVEVEAVFITWAVRVGEASREGLDQPRRPQTVSRPSPRTPPLPRGIGGDGWKGDGGEACVVFWPGLA